MTQSTAPKRPRQRRSTPKKKDRFFPGLFSLMAKQCIFSAMVFAALYYIKNSGFAFSEPVSAFIKNAALYNVTADAVKTFFSQIIS